MKATLNITDVASGMTVQVNIRGARIFRLRMGVVCLLLKACAWICPVHMTINHLDEQDDDE